MRLRYETVLTDGLPEVSVRHIQSKTREQQAILSISATTTWIVMHFSPTFMVPRGACSGLCDDSVSVSVA